MKRCNECGRIFEDTENFCNICGMRLLDAGAQENINNPVTQIVNNVTAQAQNVTGEAIPYNIPAGDRRPATQKSKAGQNKILIAALCGSAALIIALILLFTLVIPQKLSSKKGFTRRGGDDKESAAQTAVENTDGDTSVFPVNTDDNAEETPEITPAEPATEEDDEVDPEPAESSVPDETSAPGTYVEPVYIFDLSPRDHEGKIWYHYNGSVDFATNSKSYDYDKPGLVNGKVKDKDGNTYSNGLHLDGSEERDYSISFFTDGQYTRFAGYYGPYDGANDKTSQAQFEIWGDGKCLYSSDKMGLNSSSKSFSVDISGVYTVTIVYKSNSGPNDLAVIFDGRFE